DHPDLAGVTRRELEVLRLVAQGHPDRRVADELYISERTVHAHLRNMLHKTKTANRTELSSWARVRGILEP
ncbi:MAG: LuxR C-terminal-related transcriptional regulator, partial [Chloroflexota bacterium]|nr:LuxR C-terminal-related transcriptional regulator [Chloroflexota bacterium]